MWSRSAKRLNRRKVSTSSSTTAIAATLQIELSGGKENRLREGRKRLDRVAQDVHRNLCPDRQRELADPLARLRPDDDGPHEHSAAGVGEELDEAGPFRSLEGGGP